MLDIHTPRSLDGALHVSLDDLAALLKTKKAVVRNAALRDPTFPRPVKTGPGRSGYWLPDVRAWFEAKAEESRNPRPKPSPYTPKLVKVITELTACEQQAAAVVIARYQAVLPALVDIYAAAMKEALRYE